MANPPTFPSDGRITSLQNYTAALVGTELLPLVAPGNATAGINYNITVTQMLSGLLPALPQQNPNVVLAGPASGVATATPTFRSLVLADMPGGTASFPLVGNNATGAPSYQLLTVNGGGIGTAALPLNGVVLGNATALSVVSATTSGFALVSAGSTSPPTFQALPLAGLTTINNSTILGNNSGTTAIPSALTGSQVAGITEQGMTLLNVINVATAVASVTDVTSFSSNYNDYMLVFSSVVPSTTAGLKMQFYFNATTVFTTSYYNILSTATTYIDLTAGSATIFAGSNVYGYNAFGTIFSGGSATSYPVYSGPAAIWATATSVISSVNIGGAMYGVRPGIAGVAIQCTTGNIASGQIKIYGLRSAL